MKIIITFFVCMFTLHTAAYAYEPDSSDYANYKVVEHSSYTYSLCIAGDTEFRGITENGGPLTSDLDGVVDDAADYAVCVQHMIDGGEAEATIAVPRLSLSLLCETLRLRGHPHIRACGHWFSVKP